MTIPSFDIAEELQLYRFVMDSATDFILWMDSDGGIVYVNASLCKRLGYQSADLIGHPVSMIDPSWNPITWETRWEEVRRTGVWKADLIFRSRIGESVPVDLSANFVTTGGKSLCCTILKDITERHRQGRLLQDVLRQANQYRFALDQAAIVVLTNARGQITYANEKFCRISGFNIVELLGKPHQGLPSDILALAGGGRVWRGEVPNQGRDGTQYWLDLVVVPFLDEWGAPHQYMSIGYDITEKQVQAELIRQSEAALHEAQVLSKIGSYEVDAETLKVAGSRQMAINYGLRPETRDFTNVDWTEIIYDEDRERFFEQFRKAIKTGSTIDTVFRIRRKDTELVYIHCMGKPVRDDHGKVIKMIGTNQDITEKRLQEDLILEHQLKLVQASKMSTLGQMAGGVAHEINNPLAIIQGHAAMILELVQAGELTNEQTIRGADKIVQTVDRIARIVQGLRTFAHDGTGDPFVPSPIHRIVQDTLEFCQARFSKHDVDLIIPPLDEHLTIECRPTQITQVLLNLLNNAFDAVHGSPAPVGAKRPWAKIEVADLGDSLKISVTDSGTGIPADISDKIMDPFFTTKEVGKGSGLGLSISTGIVRSHHGHLALDASQANTCFAVILPKRQIFSRAA